MLPGPATARVSMNPPLIAVGMGVLLAVAGVVVNSQWGHPTSSVATVGFFIILLGILVLAASGCWSS